MRVPRPRWTRGRTRRTTGPASKPDAGPLAEPDPGPTIADPAWGPEHCPTPPEGITVGYKTGQQLPDLQVLDCEGNPHSLDEVCGASALWLFAPHGWCPHCKKTGGFAETLLAEFEGQNVAAVQVLVAAYAYGQPPTTGDCKKWQSDFGLQKVKVFYDPSGKLQSLWEQNYTALSVFVDADRVIQKKLHSDWITQIRVAISNLLSPP